MKPLDDSSVKPKRAKAFKKEYLFVIILSAIAIVIFLSGTSLFSSLKGNKSGELSYETSLENRLESLLREVDGVGKVKVFITVDGSETEQVLKQLTESENSLNSSVESIIMVGGKPYVTKTLNPNIVGVIVVCQGADKLGVKVTVTEVITTSLSVSADSIRIIKMK